MVANIYECQFCNFTGGAIEAVRHRGESQHLIRIKPTEKWLPCCSGPTHAPWCKDYVERDNEGHADEWSEPYYIRGQGWLIADKLGCIAQVRNQAIAMQIFAEHNQHQYSQSPITQLTTKLERQAETMAQLVGERDQARAETGRLREALRQIAALDDEGANLILRKQGDYSGFDEPGAVQTAREALNRPAEQKQKGK